MAEDREAVSAVVRVLRDSGTANPDAVALEVIAVLRNRGWRQVIVPAPPPGGPPVAATDVFLAARAAIQAGDGER